MRVEERATREANLNKVLMSSNNEQHKEKMSVSSSPFATMLEEEQQITKYSLELDQLKREIYEAGEKLEKSANMKDFQKFRDLITSLTDKVVKEAYRVRVVSTYLRGNRKYQVVSNINQELDALYREIMSAQKNHISIAKKVMNLKGLIINLMS